jgi:hypothetical protein
MMKKFLFLGSIAAFFLISCSDGNKFDGNSKPELELLGIVCGKSGFYIDAYANVSLRDDGKYYYSYWIIDGEIISNNDVRKRVSYGEHFLKFVLIDSFDDILNDSCSVRINEPLKVTLLSPVDNYQAEKTDTIKFQYKINGIDAWEENLQAEVYISTDKKVWKRIDSLFVPPFAEEIYYWGVKAFTEQDTTNLEEIRSIWIKK